MTVSTTTLKNSYAGNGSTTVFAYAFKIFASSEIKVYIRTDATGAETLKSETTHYTVSNVGADGGGNVTFTTGNTPASGETVVLLRDTAITQGTDYQPADPFPAESHEDALDKLTHVAQEVQEELDRAIKLSKTNTISSAEITTTAAARANKLLAFDGDGELSATQEIGTYKGNWAASTSYLVRDIVKDTSTNNIFIATVAHTSSGSQPLTTNTDSAKWALIVDAAAAATSATNAASSATAAASSATAAATSATSAATSATTSTTQASTSTTKAGEAATSATNAATSATNAASSATSASSSATSATSSASTATTKASEASTSATNAASSATAAASSATAAASSASGASTSATNAANSANAAEAAAAAIFFEFETSTTMANPSSGGVRFNNASVGSVTQICFSATSASTGNPDVSDYIVTWDDSTSPVKGHLIIRESGAPGSSIVFSVTGSVTDNTTHVIVPVAHVSSAGVSLSASDDLYFSFSRTGNAGQDGTGSMSSFTMSDGSTTQTVSDGQTQTFAAGEGLDVAVSATDTVTYSAEDATTSNKGVASFSSDNFDVSSGAVTIKDGGVVEAEIADDAVTLAKMAPGTDGVIITYDASGNPVHVGPGSDGQVLTSTGAGSPPAFEDAGGGGAWNLIGTQVASSSQTLTQTGIDATYATYCIILEDIHPSASGGCRFLLGDSSGFGETNGMYSFMASNGTDVNASNQQNETTEYTFDNNSNGINVTGAGISVGDDEGEGLCLVAYLQNARGTSMYPSLHGRGWCVDFTGTSQEVTFWGNRQDMNALDNGMITTTQIRFEFPGSTSMVTGRMTVWGIAHA